MKRIFALAICLAATLCVSSAQAAYTQNVEAKTLSGGATNFWNVLFSTNDYQSWTVLVTPSVAQPNGDLFFIDVSILDGTDNNNQGTTSAIGVGGRSNGVVYTASPTNPWVPNGAGGGNANWNVASGSLLKVNRDGSQSFSGSFSLSSPIKVGSVSATLRGRDGGFTRQWDAEAAFTPEMPGGVLLLAALLPLGLMLYKKGSF